MGGILIRKRIRRLLGLAFVMAVLAGVFSWNSFFMHNIAEAKISEFVGGRVSVSVGEVSGGIFGDMVLQDVIFFGKDEKPGTIFRLDRVEIPYRAWQVFLEKTGLRQNADVSILEAGIYFNERNPFARGYVKIYSSNGTVRISGNISLVIFGDEHGRPLKGTLAKRQSGLYDFSFTWDGENRIEGVLDPDAKSVEFNIFSVSEKDKALKIEGEVTPDGTVQLYSRLYKWRINGIEIVGDLWASIKNSHTPVFSVEAKNLLIDKRSVWDISVEGFLNRSTGNLCFEKIEWGDNTVLRGTVSTRPPFPARLNLTMKDLNLGELSKVLGMEQDSLAGFSTAEIRFEGPIKKASVSGRLFIEKGVMGEMEFVSMFATLGGELPVVTVKDARVVKDGGNIIVSGEIDFGRMSDDKALDNLKFETDNKVAVWERWQISKEETSNKVEARKDRLIFCTSFEGDDAGNASENEMYKDRDMWFKYKLDGGNNLKVEVNEDSDFWGLEHEIQF